MSITICIFTNYRGVFCKKKHFCIHSHCAFLSYLFLCLYKYIQDFVYAILTDVCSRLRFFLILYDTARKLSVFLRPKSILR